LVQRGETSVQSSLRENSSRTLHCAGMSQTVNSQRGVVLPRRLRRALTAFSPVEEAVMDRLKLETVYLGALDALMSAEEYQIQAAIFRLRRAQARLHGWEVHGSPTIHSRRRGSVNRIQSLTPPFSDNSTRCRADRRSDPTPNDTPAWCEQVPDGALRSSCCRPDTPPGGGSSSLRRTRPNERRVPNW
jgi:hypothetical protein